MDLDKLQKRLNYNPATGVWTWKITSRMVKKGMRAGSLHSDRYGSHRRHIGFNGSYYLASRLAWFYMTGRWPTLIIDHIDGNSLNDKWSNLREITKSQNCINRRYSRRM